MKLGIAFIVIGCTLLIDGGIRLAWFGAAGLTGILLAIPFLYFGLKRLMKKNRNWYAILIKEEGNSEIGPFKTKKAFYEYYNKTNNWIGVKEIRLVEK